MKRSVKLTDRFLLDTSAVVTLMDDEAGAAWVERLLLQVSEPSPQVAISTVTLMEFYYISIRRQGESEAASLLGAIRSWPVVWREPSEKILLFAGRIKAQHRLSFADAIIAATSRLTDATLVHKDPEFLPLAPALRQHPLPLKAKK